MCGSAEAAYGLAMLNGLSVTDSIAPGTVVEIPGIVNKAFAEFYKTKGLRPATDVELDENGDFTGWMDDGRIFALEFPYEFE